MKRILKILKGALIGLGSILPGVSGGMIAAAFNVYEDLINALDTFTKKPIKAILSIYEYLIGIFIGIALGFLVIGTVLKHFPLPTTMLFLGFIIGGIPKFINNVRKESLNYRHYLTAIIASLIILSVLLLNPSELSNISTPLIYVYYVLIGFFVAISLIIPGLSGTMILMALGVYTFFITNVSDFIKGIFNLDFNAILNGLPIIIIIGIAGFITLILLSKGINKVLKNKRTYFKMAVLGILLVSPINILYTLNYENSEIFQQLGFYDIIFGILTLLIGATGGYLLMKKEEGETNGLEN